MDELERHYAKFKPAPDYKMLHYIIYIWNLKLSSKYTQRASGQSPKTARGQGRAMLATG